MSTSALQMVNMHWCGPHVMHNMVHTSARKSSGMLMVGHDWYYLHYEEFIPGDEILVA